MQFTLTILGTSSALPTSSKFPTAHVLNVHERFFLIDCGEGTQMQLRRLGINLSRINHIFISHLHGDHVFGLFGLISTLSLLGRKEDLHIYSFYLLDNILKDHLKYFEPNLPFNVVVHSVDTRLFQQVYSDKNLEVFTIPLEHRVPACGFLFKEKEPGLNIHKELIGYYKIPLAQIHRIKDGENFTCEDGSVVENRILTYRPYVPRSYAFCSDTSFSPAIVQYVKGVDLLYHEATFGNELVEMAKKTGHSTTAQAAEIARLAEVKKLLIGHFSSRYKNTDALLQQAQQIFPHTIAVREGDEFSIPLQRG